MLKCSYCGKESDDGSTLCGGCGLSLDTKPGEPQGNEDPQGGEGGKRLLQGMIWFFIGGAVSLFSYSLAADSPGGGHYIIAWGAMIYGAIQMWRGWTGSTGRTSRNTEAQKVLDQAAVFESLNPAKAVDLYAEVVAKFPGTRASQEAQRNIQTLTSHSNERIA